MDAKLNQSDLISLLAKSSNISSARAEQFTKSFFDLIIEGLEQDGIVKINGLGTFKITEVASRGSVNVNTGEKIEIKGHKKLTFLPSETLKENVNQPFAMFEPVEVDDTCRLDTSDAEPEKEETSATDTVTQSVEEISVPEPVEVSVVENVVPVEEPVESAEEPLALVEEVAPVQEKVVEETIEEPVAVQERPSEPVLVRVPKKKKTVEAVTKPANKKKNGTVRNVVIAALVIFAAYFGFELMLDDEFVPVNTTDYVKQDVASVESRPVATDEIPFKTAATEEVPNATTDVVTSNMSNVATDVVPNITEVATDIIPNAATDVVPNVTEAITDIVTNEATDLVPNVADTTTVFIPATATDVVPEITDTLTTIIPNAATDVIHNITVVATQDKYIPGAIHDNYVPGSHDVMQYDALKKIATEFIVDNKFWPYIVKYNIIGKQDAIYYGVEKQSSHLIP